MYTGYVVPLRRIEPFSATLPQHSLAECDQQAKVSRNTPPQPGLNLATEMTNG